MKLLISRQTTALFSLLYAAVSYLTAAGPVCAEEKTNLQIATTMMPSAPSSVSLPEGMYLPETYKLLGDDGTGVYRISSVKSGNYGYCDATGKILIEPSEDDVRSVGDGLFIKRYYDDVNEVIELVGTNKVHIAFLPSGMKMVANKFCDGLLRIEEPINNLTGYLNHDGKFRIKPERYVHGQDFSSGYAKVDILGHANKTFSALIDRDGKIVMGPYDGDSGHRVAEFYNGLAMVYTETGEGVINASLRYVVKPIYETVQMSNEKFYTAKRNGRWCVLSSSGNELKQFPKEVTNVTCNNAGGMWLYAVGGDKDSLKDLPYGSSPKGSKMGVMDPKGKILIPPKYDLITQYDNGRAIVGKRIGTNIVYGVVDTNGKFILPIEYERVQLREGNPVDAVKTQKVTFNSDYFKTHQTNRVQPWKDFLQEFDLIGMPEQNAYKLLGDPDNKKELDKAAIYPKRARYSLVSGFCGNAWQGFVIEFDANKTASAWCMAEFMKEGPWNRDNVVFVEDKTKAFDMWGRLVPKSVAKEYK